MEKAMVLLGKRGPGCILQNLHGPWREYWSNQDPLRGKVADGKASNNSARCRVSTPRTMIDKLFSWKFLFVCYISLLDSSCLQPPGGQVLHATAGRGSKWLYRHLMNVQRPKGAPYSHADVILRIRGGQETAVFSTSSSDAHEDSQGNAWYEERQASWAASKTLKVFFA